MKKRLIVLLALFPLGLYAQNFGYQGTKNESMSKYQRIGHIEKYLETLKASISQVKSEINSKMETGDRALLDKINALERTVSLMKTDFDALKKQASNKETSGTLNSNGMRDGGTEGSPSEKDKVLDLIEENAAKIGALQASHLSLENTLKSIQELMQQKSEAN